MLDSGPPAAGYRLHSNAQPDSINFRVLSFTKTDDILDDTHARLVRMGKLFRFKFLDLKIAHLLSFSFDSRPKSKPGARAARSAGYIALLWRAACRRR